MFEEGFWRRDLRGQNSSFVIAPQERGLRSKWGSRSRGASQNGTRCSRGLIKLRTGWKNVRRAKQRVYDDQEWVENGLRGKLSLKRDKGWSLESGVAE